MNAYGVIEIVKESNLWEALTEEEKKELITNHVLTSSSFNDKGR
ncbi:MAG TPA: hypothetical protein VLD55_02795 [Candidatus Sulfobium mesophilum]|nr:hypothetical protein [Candidatus Sulfobium mesophilum]